MDRRKFIKTSMCLGCGAALIPAAQSSLFPQISTNFSEDKFIYKRKEDLPKIVRLEACSLCQLNCPACWVRINEKCYSKSFGFGYLKFVDFKNFVDDNPQLEEIELSNLGEIFLNPELDKIIEYAYTKNVKLKADSGANLNYLTDEMAELLVKCKFRSMCISIDGATPEVYKIYRRGGDFNRVIANIQKINKYKKKYNSKYPELTYKFILFGHNEHEIELAKQKAKELGMDIFFYQNTQKYYSPVKNKKLFCKLTGVDWSRPEYINLSTKKKDVFCSLLFKSPQINYNGELLGCCIMREDTYGINVFKEGLFKALNSPAIVESKRIVTDLSYVPQKRTRHSCLDCWMYHILKERNIEVLKYV